MSRYADVLHLSKAEWKAVAAEINSDDEEVKAALLTTHLKDRLSRKRCKEHLVAMVREGKVRLTTPEALYRWTYGAATVAGVKPAGIAGKKEPRVDIKEEQWAKVTPKKLADILQEYTTEKRAAECMLGVMYARIFKPSAEDVVALTNERITIDGVKAPERTRKQMDLAALIAGIE